MEILDKFRRLIESDDFEDDEFEEFEPKEESGAQKPSTGEMTAKAAPREEPAAARPKLTVHSTKVSELSVDVHVPLDFDHVARIADDLLAKRAVIVNFERVEADVQRKICDFVNGVCYVLDGEAKRIHDRMMLYVPSGVNVSQAITLPAKKK